MNIIYYYMDIVYDDIVIFVLIRLVSGVICMIMMCHIPFQIVMEYSIYISDDIIPPYRVFIIDMLLLCLVMMVLSLIGDMYWGVV